MGLNDRDYAREPDQGLHFQLPQSAVGLIIAVNIGLYILDALLDGQLSDRLALSADLFHRPWNCWQLITSAFVHDFGSVWHILFNMLLLWVTGRDVEQMYGRNEFLRLYFVAAVFSGLCWAASENWLMHRPAATMVGASGAVCCIWVLFALHFPSRMMLLGGFLPVPIWLLGVISIGNDFLGFVQELRGARIDNTAFEAHLGGAVLALLYQRFGWNFGRMLPRSVTMTAPPSRSLGNRTKLKLHQPEGNDPPVNLESEVDRILEKISASGTDSLTPEEKRTLERASARYQKRRQ